MSFLPVLIWATSILFLVYGVFCVGTTSMVADFQRFGLSNFRVLIGVLEILGGIGLLVGLKWRPALWISSMGLSLLMLIAFGVRLKMRDSAVQSIPSLALMCINLYIFIRSIRA